MISFFYRNFSAQRLLISLLSLMGVLFLEGCTTNIGNVHDDLTNIVEKNLPLSSRGQSNLATSADINTGIGHLKNKNYPLASKSFNTAIRLSPQNSLTHYLNALTYHLWGVEQNHSFLAHAEVGYTTSLALDPGNSLASYNLGQLYMNANNYKKAQDHFANALLTAPNDPLYLFCLAVSSYLCQDIETAVEALSYLEKQEDSNEETRRIAVLIYAAANNFEKAKENLAQLASPTSPAEEKLYHYLQKRLLSWENFYKTSHSNMEDVSLPISEEPLEPDVKKPLTSSKNSSQKKSSKSNTSEAADHALPKSQKGKKSSSQKKSSKSDDSEAADHALPKSQKGEKSSSQKKSSKSDVPQASSEDDSSSSSDSSGSSSDSSESSPPPTENSDDSDSGDGEYTSPRSQRMIVLNVMILQIDRISTQSYGNNILNVLNVVGGNINTVSGDSITTFGTKHDSSLTPKNVRTNMISIGALTYSLNAANDTQNHNELLATPSLIATHGKTSNFFSGIDYTLALTSTQGGGNLVNKEVGITLSLTPFFLNNGKIVLKVNALRTIVSNNPLPGNLTNTAILVPTFQSDKSSVDATSVLAPGESLVLSGLTERVHTKARSEVPLLGDLPVASFLFSKDTTEVIESSILFIISPEFPEKIVRDSEGNWIVIPEKHRETSPYLDRLKKEYINIYSLPESDSFLKKLSEPEYSRNFRPTDMPVKSVVYPNLSDLLDNIQEISPEFNAQ